MICVFNKSGKWAGWHLHSPLTAALIWILNHRLTHFINEHVPPSALHSSPERQLSELNSEFKRNNHLYWFFYCFSLELNSGRHGSSWRQSAAPDARVAPDTFFTLPCLVSFTAPASTKLRRPLQPRFTFSASSCHRLWAAPKLMWQRRHGEEKKQVNVISLGTPPWALCYCHICRHIIDFYTVAWKEWLIDQNLEVPLSRQQSWQVRWKQMSFR